METTTSWSFLDGTAVLVLRKKWSTKQPKVQKIQLPCWVFYSLISEKSACNNSLSYSITSICIKLTIMAYKLLMVMCGYYWALLISVRSRYYKRRDLRLWKNVSDDVYDSSPPRIDCNMISVLSPSKLRLVKSGFPWPKMNILPQPRCARQTKLSLLNFHLIPRPNIQKNIEK